MPDYRIVWHGRVVEDADSRNEFVDQFINGHREKPIHILLKD